MEYYYSYQNGNLYLLALPSNVEELIYAADNNLLEPNAKNKLPQKEEATCVILEKDKVICLN